MPNSFTPQQIEQFLQEFFDVVGARQYIGARYVPIFGRAGEDTVEWNNGAPYEPLTVVMHEGVSYVSRRYVPSGIRLADTDYWVQTYRFNAQVEQYRQEVLRFQGQIDAIREDLESDYVAFPQPPTNSKYGSTGQVLTTLGDGDTQWNDPVVVTSEIAGPLIDEWLNDHPEATTTVEDGSITNSKLNDNVNWGNLVSMHDELYADNLNPLLRDLLVMRDDYFPHSFGMWEVGSINAGTGAEMTSTARLRSELIELPNSNTLIFVIKKDAVRVYFYDMNNDFIEASDYITTVGTHVLTVPTNARKMRLVLRLDTEPSPFTVEALAQVTGIAITTPTEAVSTDVIRDGAITAQKLDPQMQWGNLQSMQTQIHYDNLDASRRKLTVARYDMFPHSFDSWVQGSINSSGVETETTFRIRSVFMPIPTTLKNIAVIVDGSDEHVRLYFFDENQTFISTPNYVTADTLINVPSGTQYMRLVYYVGDGEGNIDVTVISESHITLTTEYNMCDELGKIPWGNLEAMQSQINYDNINPTLAGLMVTGIDYFPHSVERWEQGSINAGTGELVTVTKRLRTANPIEIERTDLRVTLGTDEHFRIFFYDENDAFISPSPYFTEDHNVTVPPTAVYMRYIYYAGDGEGYISPTQIIESNVALVTRESPLTSEGPTHINVCTYNVGKYNRGVAGDIDPDVVVPQMRAFFRTRSIDIMGIQEERPELATNITSDDAIYSTLFPYILNYGNDWTAIKSKFPLHNAGTGTLAAGSRHYVYGDVEINHMSVFVIIVHLSVQPSQRADNITELLGILSTKERFIMLGDFNAGNGNDWDAQPDYNRFINAGYNTANGGYFGLFDTYRLNQGRKLDSVVTSPNIIIETVDVPGIYESMPSDHLPMLCTLSIM